MEGIAIDNIESVISNFDKKHQKRIIRYMMRRLRKLKREVRKNGGE